MLTEKGEAIAILVSPEQWDRMVEELEFWQDSYAALEARYRVAVGEDEIVDWIEIEAELDDVSA